MQILAVYITIWMLSSDLNKKNKPLNLSTLALKDNGALKNGCPRTTYVSFQFSYRCGWGGLVCLWFHPMAQHSTTVFVQKWAIVVFSRYSICLVKGLVGAVGHLDNIHFKGKKKSFRLSVILRWFFHILQNVLFFLWITKRICLK